MTVRTACNNDVIVTWPALRVVVLFFSVQWVLVGPLSVPDCDAEV